MQSISPDSAIGRELYPEQAAWATREKTNSILADIYNMLALINENYVTSVSKNHVFKMPKKYPRPWKNDQENENHIGSGAMPPDELEKWMEKKREQYARSSSGDLGSNAST